MTEPTKRGRPRREDRRVGLHIEISETAHKALVKLAKRHAATRREIVEKAILAMMGDRQTVEPVASPQAKLDAIKRLLAEAETD